MLPPLPDASAVMIGILALLRISTMIILFPVTGHALVPAPVKVGLIALLTMVMYPVASQNAGVLPDGPVAFAVAATGEMLLAALVALIAQLLMSSIQFAGQVMSFQMGLAMSSVFDPSSNSQVPLVGQLAMIVGMLLWLASGAEAMALASLVDSFRLFPVGSSWGLLGVVQLIQAVSEMFVIALRLMAPVLLLLLMVYVALGLISRAVPQIQVFFVSYPLTVGLGLFLFALSLPPMMQLLQDLFGQFGTRLESLFFALSAHGDS